MNKNECIDCGVEKIFCKERCRRCYNKVYNNSSKGKAVQKKYNDKKRDWKKGWGKRTYILELEDMKGGEKINDNISSMER